MKKTALILILISILTSCQKSKEVSKIVRKDWLLGKWENNSDTGNLTETWDKLNDSIFNGAAYFIKGKDTLHFEKMQLLQKGEELVYISSIRGQNNDKAISLLHNIEIENPLVFENPKNDYPKKISYSLISNDSIVIQISGIQQGKSSSVNYSLNKIK